MYVLTSSVVAIMVVTGSVVSGAVVVGGGRETVTRAVSCGVGACPLLARHTYVPLVVTVAACTEYIA